MRHIALVSCRRERPAVAGHTPEEVSKFIQGVLAIAGSAVGVLASIEELRDLKQGTVDS